MSQFGPHVLALDLDAEAERIAGWMRDALRGMRRRGLVVAMSGGIDSSVCAALAVRAVGRERVSGLFLPERDSSSRSTDLGRQLAAHLGIEAGLHDIAPPGGRQRRRGGVACRSSPGGIIDEENK